MSGFISSLLKKRHSPTVWTEEEASQMNFGLARVFKYEELKKATNSFNTELGKGGYGKVYFGKLQGGQKVAVKVLFDRNPKQLEQFFNEVAVLSRLRHKNLVSLYGCTSPRSQELLLVYEYAPNGTVADHLHIKQTTNNQTTLTWAMRVQIATETAEALAYLHALEPAIIHRDVKTSNILLDNEFHVKVADLGICRLLPWDSSHVSTVPQGTMGYRDPEYDRYFRLTDKTDVYSFGVVLMELISAQQAVDVNRDPEDIYLDGMALDKILNKKLDEFVDPILGYHSNNDVRRMIDSLAELASHCLQPKGDMRPPMVHVFTVLKGIQNEIHQMQRPEEVILEGIQNGIQQMSLQDGGQEEVNLKGIQNGIHQMQHQRQDGGQEEVKLKRIPNGIHQMQRQDGGQEGVKVNETKYEKQQKVTNSFDPRQELGDGCLNDSYPGVKHVGGKSGRGSLVTRRILREVIHPMTVKSAEDLTPTDRGVLSVTIKSAEDLTPMGLIGKANPYVILWMEKMKTKNKTRVVNDSLYPVWNQTFDLIVEDPLHNWLTLEVWDHDTFGKVYMGRCIVTLTRVLTENGYHDSLPLDGTKSGKLNLHLKWSSRPIYRDV